MMFIVVKEGVYDHGVFFIGEEKDAISAAEKFAKADHDNYHEWCVREFIQPTLNTDTRYWYRGYEDNCKEVFSVRQPAAIGEGDESN